MADWPAAVPQNTARDGFTLSGPVNAVVSTQMDIGPPKRRARTTAAMRNASVTWALWTDAQLDAFEAWFSDDLMMGALSFTMLHPRTQASRLWLFKEGYQITPDGVLWRVTADLLLFP